MTEKREVKEAKSPTIGLLKATSRGKIYKVIQAIDEGAELAINKHGHTALHIACHKGFLDIVKVLISAGCEIDIQDDNGDTALHRACIAGNDLIARRLIEEGCSVDRQNRLGDTALHEAASRGYSRCVKELINGQANVAIKNKNSDTAIHLASANSHSGSLRRLLSSYPHSSVTNDQGDSPLHLTVRFGHVTCSRVLISSKCNVNLQNKMGNTPLHVATLAQHHKLVRILLNAGACPKSIRNNDKKSAVDLAKDNEFGEIVIMLTSGPYHNSTVRGRTRHVKRYGTAARRSKSETRIRDSDLPNHVADKKNLARLHVDGAKLKSSTLPQKQHLTRKQLQPRDAVMKSQSGDLLEMQQHSLTVNPFVVPQLYSLYRDCNGNVQQQPVLDRLPNPTAEIVSTLANAVADTKDELLEEMRKTSYSLERRLSDLEHNTNFRVAKLDQVTKERIHAERTRCLHRIDRRAMMERAVLSCQNEQNYAQTQTTHEPGDIKPLVENRLTVKNLEYEPNNRSHSVPAESVGTTLEDALVPYRTVKISKEGKGASQHAGLSNENVKKVKDHMSDSAYSSLCPQSSCKGALHRTTSRTSPDQFQPKTLPFDNYQYQSTLSTEQLKPNISRACHRDCAVTSSVTQQLFENVTHAMEDWYERRLREITEKQRSDMDRKVAELENKVKLLELSQNQRNDSALCSNVCKQ